MTPPGAPALHVDGLSVRFGARAALDRVGLDVRPGEFVALVGPNGSGKTTLLRAGLGLCPPSAGSVELFGDPVARLDVPERARRVAWVPQEEGLRDNVRIGTYVLYGRYSRQRVFEPDSPEDRAVAAAALAEVGLADRADDGVLEVSGGERQRLVLARALCQATPLLLLDEPTAHLDLAHQLELLARVRALATGRKLAVLAALHDLNLAARFADRIAVLSRGRLVADGPPGTVLTSTLLGSVWGITAEMRTDPRSGLPYLLPAVATERLPAASTGGRWGPVHVVGGGGAAAPWMRALVEAGFDVTAGALHLLDTDSETAEALGVPVAMEAPFAPLSDAVRARNRELLRAARAILVAPFATGPSNLANLEDVAALGVTDRLYLAVAPPGVELDFTNGAARRLRERMAADGATWVPTPDDLVRRLREGVGGAPSPDLGGRAT